MRLIWLGMVLIIGPMALMLLSLALAWGEIEAFTRAQQYLNLWVYLLTWPSMIFGVVLIGAGLAWVAVKGIMQRNRDA
ncbi:MAG: hypothetical protein V4516_02210 [Pseudomonadota bacterium]